MKKILIVDDEPYIRELVSTTLKGDEYKILEAGDGEEALQIARNEMPDLILLDIRMPKKDGLEVCRELKSDPKTSSLYIVILTAYGQEVEKERGREAGADGYFVKPFSPIALLKKVEELLA